ncbi:MAG: hypothetical protein GY842_16230 [bacterium]|nr:hypothetical protein [bacterium]
MEYDADNRLTMLYIDVDGDRHYIPEFDDNSLTAEYVYDALGRRIQFTNYSDRSGIYGAGTPEVTTRYVYDGQNVIEEYDDSATPARQRYYVHGSTYIDERAVLHDDDAPGAGADAADYYYLLKDLYTVVGLLNMQGHDVERYTYDAYGGVTVVGTLVADFNFDGVVDIADVLLIPRRFGDPCAHKAPFFDRDGDGDIGGTDRNMALESPPAENEEIPASRLGNPYFFTGRRVDMFPDAAVGLGDVHQIQYNRARSYDLTHGRWLQRDPAGYMDGMNLYQYLRSRPTFLLDPSGMLSNDEFLALAKRVAESARFCDEFSMTNDERMYIARTAVQLVTRSAQFKELIEAGSQSVEFWEKFLKAYDSPWDTVDEFYGKYLDDLDGAPFAMGSDLRKALKDKKASLKALKRVRIFVDGSQVAYNFINADKLTASEAIQSFADILEFGNGLQGEFENVQILAPALAKLDGIGAMLSFYAEAITAISQKVGQITDQAARNNVRAIELCTCPTRAKAPFGHLWARNQNRE